MTRMGGCLLEISGSRFIEEFFSFSLTLDPMGVKISKRYSYKSQPKAFKLFLNFFPNGPHPKQKTKQKKKTFGSFEILNIQILTIFFCFLNMGPYGSEHFKTLFLLQ